MRKPTKEADSMTNIIAEHKKLQAAVKLLAALAKGVESIRTEGLLTIDEAFAWLDEEKQDPKEA